MPEATPTPGVVLGPDGKPCKACKGSTDFRAWRKAFATAPPPPAAAPPACPPDSAALGRATWTFLHSAAAHYPVAPSAAQRAHMLAMLRALPVLYPCPHCAAHMAESMAARPPDAAVAARAPLSRWLCERHNEVNALLGKPAFDCDTTDARWGAGPQDGSCD